MRCRFRPKHRSILRIWQKLIFPVLYETVPREFRVVIFQISKLTRTFLMEYNLLIFLTENLR
jgi:hypothetical protein